MSEQEMVYFAILMAMAMGAVGYFAVGCGIVMALGKVRGVYGTSVQRLDTILHFGIYWPRYIFGGTELP